MSMHNDIESVLFSEEDIKETVQRLGKQISEEYRDKNLFLVTVLKGSLVFMADLMRAIDIHCSIDFLAVSSYGNGIKTSGEVQVIKDLTCPLHDKDVLIVEDILDSGVTLSYLIETFKARQPKSLRICTLLDKPANRRANVFADYIGMEVGDQFIVGYGLDYAEKYRNLPYIGVLKPEAYSS